MTDQEEALEDLMAMGEFIEHLKNGVAAAIKLSDGVSVEMPIDMLTSMTNVIEKFYRALVSSNEANSIILDSLEKHAL